MTLDEAFENHIKPKGGDLPRASSDTYKALEYLYNRIGKFCKRSSITNHIKYSGGDFQHLKNLKNYGWNVVTSGHGKTFGATLINLDIHPTFNSQSKLDSITCWETLKAERDFCCFTCGSKEGQPIWGNSSICKLQKGHMDPRLPLTDDNCIPQCQQCNQPAQNKFIFDKRGRVIKCLHDAKPIKTDSTEVI